MSNCPRGGREIRSAGLHREHSLAVPAHRHQIPLAFDVIEPLQQALAIAHHRFDDAEHGFWSLLAQPVEFFPTKTLYSRAIERATRWRFVLSRATSIPITTRSRPFASASCPSSSPRLSKCYDMRDSESAPTPDASAVTQFGVTNMEHRCD